jgi:hypothetical protein
MNLKQAKKLRKLVRSQDCQSLYTQYTKSPKRGQHNCIEVWANCRRGIYLKAKKLLKTHNFNPKSDVLKQEVICL